MTATQADPIEYGIWLSGLDDHDPGWLRDGTGLLFHATSKAMAEAQAATLWPSFGTMEVRPFTESKCLAIELDTAKGG